MDEEKFSFYRHFAEKDSTDYATVNQVHQIVTGQEEWPVWVRGRSGNKPSLADYTKEIRGKRTMMIENGYHKDQVKREFADIKKALPCVAWSSVMLPSRNANNAVHHSGLICVDFDNLDQAGTDRLWNQVAKDPHTLYTFLSPSAAGVKVVVRVDGMESWLPKADASPQSELNKCLQDFHAAAVETVWNYFEHLGVEIDEDCKDISRLCFLCHDKEAYYNPDAPKLEVPAENPVERAKRLLAENAKAEKKNKKERSLRPEDRVPLVRDSRTDDSKPDWLNDALNHLKVQEMTHGEKTSLVFALATVYAGSDDGLQAALEFFRERTVGEQLDERQIENTYAQNQENVSAGTIWHLAKEKGWQPPARKPRLRTSEETKETDIDVVLAAIDLTKGAEVTVGEEIAGKSIIDLADVVVSDDETLLGNRYLCRGGGMLYVGPSGVGKSSSSMQQDICWAVGREAFGIVPRRPLKILTIQAENDEGDLKEMAEGVLTGLKLTTDELNLLRENTKVVTCNWAVSDKFIVNALIPALNSFRPDIVRLDPYNAYLGGDPKDTERTIKFLRAWINQVAVKFRVGVIINHHTPKTNYRDTSNYKPGDWMYVGAGDADMTNWARAILVIDHTKDSQVYRFIAAKRGTRLGWTDADGKPTIEKFFIHASKRASGPEGKENGMSEIGAGLYWLEATESEVVSSKKAQGKKATEMDRIMRLVEHLANRSLSHKERKHTLIRAWVVENCGVAASTAKKVISSAEEFLWIENTMPDTKKDSNYVVTDTGLAKLQDYTGNVPKGADLDPNEVDSLVKLVEAV